MVHPNEGQVLQLFGDYRGTVYMPGLRGANALYSKSMVSNLLTVLCGERVAQPVLNAGSFH